MTYSKEVKAFLDYALQSFDLHQVGNTIFTPDGPITVTQDCVDAINELKSHVDETFIVTPAPDAPAPQPEPTPETPAEEIPAV